MKPINNEIEVISRDAIFASVFNGFIGYATGLNQELWRDMTASRLKIIMPNDFTTNEGKNTALFIFMVANLTQNVDIEAEVLNLLRPYKGLYDAMSKIDYSSFDLSSDETIMKVADLLAKTAFGAGVKSLKAGFDELDAIAIEYGVKNHSEEEISEAVRGAK